MRAFRSPACRGLVWVLVLAPVIVRPKSINFEENEWAATESKQESGKFDKFVDKNAKTGRTVDSTDSSVNLLQPGDDAANRLLNPEEETPLAQPSESTSGGSSAVTWGILASLCIAGVGLAAYSYYASRARHMAPW